MRHRGPGAGDDRRRRLRRRDRVPRHPPISRWSAPTRPAAPAGTPPSSRAATGRAPSRSASRGSPTSSSPTALFMYLTAISVIAMAALALRRRAPSRAFWIAPLILVGQIALGAINVWAGKHAGLIIGHLALGTTLWATVVYATATLLPASAPAPERVGEPQATGAATGLMESATTTTPPVDAGIEAGIGTRSRLGESSFAGTVRDYIALTKPRIISLLLLTTVATMIVADRGFPADLDRALDDARRLPGRRRRRGDQPLHRPRPRRAHGPHPRPAAGRRPDRAAARARLRDRARRARDGPAGAHRQRAVRACSRSPACSATSSSTRSG